MQFFLFVNFLSVFCPGKHAKTLFRRQSGEVNGVISLIYKDGPTASILQLRASLADSRIINPTPIYRWHSVRAELVQAWAAAPQAKGERHI